MRKTLTANSDKSLLAAIREIQQAYEISKYINIKIDTGRQRTNQQRKAIEVFCAQLADVLNDSGMDMQAVFDVKEVSVPWSQERVKDVLFRPIMAALLGISSTVDLERADCSRVHNVLCKNLSEKLGITCPDWPRKENKDGA